MTRDDESMMRLTGTLRQAVVYPLILKKPIHFIVVLSICHLTAHLMNGQRADGLSEG